LKEQGRLVFFSLLHTYKGEKEEGGKFVLREWALEVVAESNRFYFTPIIMLIGPLKAIGCVGVCMGL
jgi:hypothetical protein